MIERNVKMTTIVKVDVIEGEILSDLNDLIKIILNNRDNKLSNNKLDSRNEDSYCPHIDVIDEIIFQMKTDFYAATNEQIDCVGYWGHIHEKNMSTNTHNHGTCYVSSVLYLSAPEGSGDLVFIPKINQYQNNAYKCSFPPKKGKYYLFPSYLDHYVTRNQSDEKRISISFNFEKV